jgi:hypothetical protein
MFRDENARITRKERSPKIPTERKARHNHKKVVKDLDVAASAFPCSSTTAVSALSAPGSEMLLNADAQSLISQMTFLPLRPSSTTFNDPGIDFFFTHYVAVISPFSNGQLDPSSSHLWRHLSTDKPFNDAVSSVGLAGLSNATKDQSLMVGARNKYASTMTHVMAALKDLGNADLVHTFKAVLMLAIFEVSLCSSLFGIFKVGSLSPPNSMNGLATVETPKPTLIIQRQNLLGSSVASRISTRLSRTTACLIQIPLFAKLTSAKSNWKNGKPTANGLGIFGHLDCGSRPQNVRREISCVSRLLDRENIQLLSLGSYPRQRTSTHTSRQRHLMLFQYRATAEEVTDDNLQNSY